MKGNSTRDGIGNFVARFMTGKAVLSVDGACSGKKAACAAVCSRDGHIIAKLSRFIPGVEVYALAAEIAGIGLAARHCHVNSIGLAGN